MSTYVEDGQKDGNTPLRSRMDHLHLVSDDPAETQKYLGMTKLVVPSTRIPGARFISQLSQCDQLQSFLDESPERDKSTRAKTTTGHKFRSKPSTLDTSSTSTRSTTGFLVQSSMRHDAREWICDSFCHDVVDTWTGGTIGLRKSSTTSGET